MVFGGLSLRIVFHAAFAMLSSFALLFLSLKVDRFAIYFMRIKRGSSNSEFLIIVKYFFITSHDFLFSSTE